MKLFYRQFGESGDNLIIVHGLYGASDNWVSIARQLQNTFRVYVVDLRNHGQSPHSPSHSYQDLTADLLEFFQEHKINKAHLLGHSMGGKTVMTFAINHPEYVKKIIIADIAPKPYTSVSHHAFTTNNHFKIIEAMMQLDLPGVKNRKEIDDQLKKHLADLKLRQFLLKNIQRKKDGNYTWRLNLDAIKNNLEEIMDGFSQYINTPPQTDISTIFLKGKLSGYILDDDMLFARKLFPDSQLITIPYAGHWLHAEQPDLFIKTVNYFLSE
ncbi:alpha/beta fold hydrolase [Marinilabiliaceae bacterium JC017]|nr:alpha/beta fold hydrolase [Marinilabiliaceae bacterium JC017]